MPEDEVKRLRESLAKALRHAEVSRDLASAHEHTARRWEREARKWRNVNLLLACLFAMSVVLMMIWGFNR